MKRYFFWFCLMGISLRGQEPFPPLFNSEPEASGQPMPADQAAAGWKLPPGFRVQVFASEPEVQNPIDLSWDSKGRLWVAENYTYAERGVRFDLTLRDRVLILEDEDLDGRADKRTVFFDDVQMLSSVEVGHKGVWLLCPPRLLFVPDADGDDKPDGPPEVVLDGFTVAKDNYHNFANGLRWGPDGWLYGRCGHSCPGMLGIPGTPDKERVPIKGGIWRWHPRKKIVEVLCHGTTNPWGHDWDKYGELFYINTVNGHLWHMISGAHFKESSGSSPNPLVFDRLDTCADHWHFDTTKSWTESRGGKANDLGGGHAHIGMMIYQADQWPERYRDRLFTWNMHGQRANVERLERQGSGFTGKHEPDVFLAVDPWFRGMEISTGPDGSGYVLDWSDAGECHDHTGVHRTSGRIYRITHGDGKKRDVADLHDITVEGVERLIRSPNVWYDRQLRVVLSGGDVPADVVSLLMGLLANQNEDLVIRLRALWHLHVCGSLSREMLLKLLGDEEDGMRVWATRLLTEEWPIDTLMSGVVGKREPDAAVLARFLEQAAMEESAFVRLAFASLLQRLPMDGRIKMAQILMRSQEDGGDRWIPSLVWYGLIPLMDHNKGALISLVPGSSWPEVTRWMSRALALEMKDDPAVLDELWVKARDFDGEGQQMVMSGVLEGLKGMRRVRKPESWDAFALAVEQKNDEASMRMIRDLRALFGDGKAVEEMKALVLDDKEEPAIRARALEALLEVDAEGVRELCEKMILVRGLGGVAIRGLSRFDDPALGDFLLNSFGRLNPEERVSVINALVTRPTWTSLLLDRMEKGQFERTAINAFQARQIKALGDERLARRLEVVWGTVRDTAADKREQIEVWRKKLTRPSLAEADLPKGRMLFQSLCATCHKLYGEGGALGPDLTGSGRANLDYLLENVIDPGGTVGVDYRMSFLTLKDGRKLGGIVSQRGNGTVLLRQLTEETVVSKEDIVKEEQSTASLMPEGLIQALEPNQVRDLFGYLGHASQVPLPKDQ